MIFKSSISVKDLFGTLAATSHLIYTAALPNNLIFIFLPQLRVSVEKCHLLKILSCFQSWSSVQILSQPILLIWGIQTNLNNHDQLAKPLQRDTVRSCSSSSRFLLQHIKQFKGLNCSIWHLIFEEGILQCTRISCTKLTSFLWQNEWHHLFSPSKEVLED